MMYKLIVTITITLTIITNRMVRSQSINNDNDNDDEETMPFDMNQSMPIVKQLDINEPYLWQMAAFATRQMSTKQRKMKLATLNDAEQIDSINRLRVTIHPVTIGQPIDKNDVLYCTIDVKINPQMVRQSQQWTVETYGCTIPAIVRRRRPVPKKSYKQEEVNQLKTPTTTRFELPMDNTISNLNEIERPKTNFKRHVQLLPPRQMYQPMMMQYPMQTYYPSYPRYQFYYN